MLQSEKYERIQEIALLLEELMCAMEAYINHVEIMNGYSQQLRTRIDALMQELNSLRDDEFGTIN